MEPILVHQLNNSLQPDLIKFVTHFELYCRITCEQKVDRAEFKDKR